MAPDLPKKLSPFEWDPGLWWRYWRKRSCTCRTWRILRRWLSFYYELEFWNGLLNSFVQWITPVLFQLLCPFHATLWDLRRISFMLVAMYPLKLIKCACDLWPLRRLCGGCINATPIQGYCYWMLFQSVGCASPPLYYDTVQVVKYMIWKYHF